MNAPLDPDLLPWSAEAEQSVLGALMLDPRAADLAGPLEARHFFEPRHGAILDAAMALLLASKPADIIAVHDRLQSGGHLDDVGGLLYLNQLTQSVPSVSNVKAYADIVREKAAQRALIETADRALSIAQGKGTVSDKLDAIGTMFAALTRESLRKEPRRLDRVVLERIDRIQGLGDGTVSPGWPTHIPRLNRMLGGGLQPGRTYILAARPSIGKSSLSEDLGLHLADRGIPVLMLSQEMPDGEVGDRALANLGGIDYERLQTGDLTNDDWSRLTEAAERGAALPFHVDDQPALRMSDIRAKARLVFRKQGGVLIVDYLQLCSGTGRDNRNNDLEEISRGLKELAKTMGLAVVILSQLNREVEKRADKRPMLADLRDSGAIEQDADVVIFLWSAREAEIGGLRIVGCGLDKNRQGKKGEFALGFHGPTQRWRESDVDVRPPAIPHVRRSGDDL